MADEINCLEVTETEETNEELPNETPVEIPTIQYTKTGRVKKPTSEAQKEALRKAREAYIKKHTETAELRKESELVMAQTKIKQQTERMEKIKSKMKKEDGIVEPEVEPVVETPPPIVRQKAKSQKKPMVIVQQNSDSESEDDNDNVIFIKRRTKKKETPKPEPIPNPFSSGFRFYDRSAMS